MPFDEERIHDRGDDPYHDGLKQMAINFMMAYKQAVTMTETCPLCAERTLLTELVTSIFSVAYHNDLTEEEAMRLIEVSATAGRDNFRQLLRRN